MKLLNNKIIKNNFLKRRKNILRKIFITTIILMFLLIIGITTSGNQSYELNEIEISSGDTLWSIVEENYRNKYNTRKLVYKIREINELEQVILNPGDKILIPETDKEGNLIK